MAAEKLGSNLPGVRVPALLADVATATDVTEVSASLRDIWARPKVELHIHLDGALRPTTVTEMARRYEPATDLWAPGWERDFFSFQNLGEFVSQFSAVGRACVRDADDVHRVAAECFEDLAAQNVVYAEASFGTRTPGMPHYIPLPDVIAAVDQARRDVESRAPIKIGVIVGLTRRRPNETSVDISALALQCARDIVDAVGRGAGIVGVDLHGDELNQPSVEPFLDAFDIIHQAGLKVRPHAGEAAGAHVVRDSLQHLKAHRIAHGVRSIEDAALVADLHTAGIGLDMCLTSNVRTGAIRSIAEHPLPSFLRRGLRVSVSSDDPLPFSTSITSELAVARHVLGLNRKELAALSTNAASNAFLVEAERTALVERVARGWEAVH
ncbi:MAG: adenosine deaminase [Chloroflexota bacterium]